VGLPVALPAGLPAGVHAVALAAALAAVAAALAVPAGSDLLQRAVDRAGEPRPAIGPRVARRRTAGSPSPQSFWLLL
jgi:hypothetical protein